MERFSHLQWTTEKPQTDYFLEYKDNKVMMQKQSGPEHPLVVDFALQWKEWKQQKISIKSDLLAKACSLSKGKKILDLTMGLANDSLKLIYFGAHVTAVEKQPMIFALVRDALDRFEQALELQLVAADVLTQSASFFKDFDVFYMDPMFHLEKRTALPKKKMQFLADIIGKNTDEEFSAVFKVLQNYKKRIVIKRHPDAPHFLSLKPKNIYAGKKIRFEVF